MTSSAITASTSVKLSSSRLRIDTPTAHPDLGRSLVVTQAVSAGSLLVRLNPLISVLDDSLLDKACSACFVSSKSVDPTYGKELMKCTGCRFLHYCSKVDSPQPLKLTAGMSEEGLEESPFEGMQIPSTQCEHSSGITSGRNAAGKLIR